jgi:hypothetical protein
MRLPFIMSLSDQSTAAKACLPHFSELKVRNRKSEKKQQWQLETVTFGRVFLQYQNGAQLLSYEQVVNSAPRLHCSKQPPNGQR